MRLAFMAGRGGVGWSVRASVCCVCVHGVERGKKKQEEEEMCGEEGGNRSSVNVRTRFDSIRFDSINSMCGGRSWLAWAHPRLHTILRGERRSWGSTNASRFSCSQEEDPKIRTSEEERTIQAIQARGLVDRFKGDSNLGAQSKWLLQSWRTQNGGRPAHRAVVGAVEPTTP